MPTGLINWSTAQTDRHAHTYIERKHYLWIIFTWVATVT